MLNYRFKFSLQGSNLGPSTFGSTKRASLPPPTAYTTSLQPHIIPFPAYTNLGVFFSAGKPATMPRPALVACAHQLPRSLDPLAACMSTDLSGMLELVHMLTSPCVLADAGRPRCSGVR